MKILPQRVLFRNRAMKVFFVTMFLVVVRFRAASALLTPLIDVVETLQLVRNEILRRSTVPVSAPSKSSRDRSSHIPA